MREREQERLTVNFLASYLGRWGLEEGGRCAWHGEKPSCTRSGDDIAVRGREGDAHEAQPLLHCNSEKFNFCTDRVVFIDCKKGTLGPGCVREFRRIGWETRGQRGRRIFPVVRRR